MGEFILSVLLLGKEDRERWGRKTGRDKTIGREGGLEGGKKGGGVGQKKGRKVWRQAVLGKGRKGGL